MGTDTDNSEDFAQEELAAALSHHLHNSMAQGGTHPTSIHPKHLNTSAPPHPQHYNHQQNYSHPQQNVYPLDLGQYGYSAGEQHHEDVNNNESHLLYEDGHPVDVELDSPHTPGGPLHPSAHRPPHHLSQELKLDFTCFQDEGEKKKLQKRKEVEQPVPLSMKPGGEELNPSNVDRSQTEPPREVISSLSGERPLISSLPPIHASATTTEPLPLSTTHDTNGLVKNERDTRSPIPRSKTPRGLGPPRAPGGKGRRGRKDNKHASTDNLRGSVEDVSHSASKKKPFRTSLKNLFQRKK
jgi:hypothetical protein